MTMSAENLAAVALLGMSQLCHTPARPQQSSVSLPPLKKRSLPTHQEHSQQQQQQQQSRRGDTSSPLSNGSETLAAMEPADRKTSSKRRKKSLPLEPSFPVQPRIIQVCKMPRTHVDHSYRDFSMIPVDPDFKPCTDIRVMTFGEKLHHILSSPEYSHIITWAPHGRAFSIPLPHKLEQADILLKYFSHNRYSRFLSQLKNHGLKSLESDKNKGLYYHEFMLRGCPHLTKYLPAYKECRKLQPDPKNEPDFDMISSLCPLPEAAAPANKSVSKDTTIVNGSSTKENKVPVESIKCPEHSSPALAIDQAIVPVVTPTPRESKSSSRSRSKSTSSKSTSTKSASTKSASSKSDTASQDSFQSAVQVSPTTSQAPSTASSNPPRSTTVGSSTSAAPEQQQRTSSPTSTSATNATSNTTPSAPPPQVIQSSFSPRPAPTPQMCVNDIQTLLRNQVSEALVSSILQAACSQFNQPQQGIPSPPPQPTKFDNQTNALLMRGQSQQQQQQPQYSNLTCSSGSGAAQPRIQEGLRSMPSGQNDLATNFHNPFNPVNTQATARAIAELLEANSNGTLTGLVQFLGL